MPESRPPDPRTAEHLPSADGWTALAERRWADAASSFRAKLARAETPEAFEGLSWAAWWLDDAATVFDAREHAYRLYRERDRPGDAARMAVWLGSDHLDFHGASAVANGWLRRARRLLDELEAGPDHGWLAFHEGYLASISGDADTALARAARATELGRVAEVPDLEMLGLALEGAVLVSGAEVERGMHRLDEATAMALQDEAGVPISAAWTCCFLVTACEAVRDYERAFEWCDRIRDFARRYGSRYMLGFCRAHYSAVHLWRGRWADAEDELESALDDYERSRPAFAGGVRTALAELRRRQGRAEEAEALLDVAGAPPAHLCRARLALDAGDATRAAELCERLLRQGRAAGTLRRFEVLELLVRVAALDGRHERAAAALEELREVERAVGTRPLRAAADVAEGVLAAGTGDHERARQLLEDAVDAFDRSGAPYDAARARFDLACTLAAVGRTEAARREARAALATFDELGAAVDARRARALLGDGGGRSDAPPLPVLTPREREVLRLVAEGLTNRGVAGRLFISEHTVHRHVANILRKLDVPTRTAAATAAAQAGLLREA